MAKRFGLGAGLDALMGSAAQDGAESAKDGKKTAAKKPELAKGLSADENGRLFVEVALLKPNPQQPRTVFNQDELDELAASIKENGIIQPVTIEDAGDGFFYIIAGERRTRAAKIAGVEKIPVQLVTYSDEKKLEIALIENIQRSDLNAIEEAKAYYKLMELSGLSQDQVAAKVGKNRSTVANAVRLLKLPEDMQGALVQGKISAGHARAILSVADATDQQILFGKIMGQGMSVRQAEEAAAALNGGSKPKKNPPAVKADLRDPDFANLEQQFIDVLGTKVVLKGSPERGSISIDYFSRADLNRLYEIFTGNKA
ncbi:MAG: ParB/RepB/Spo0J family partition protein [Treponemataceae bacterium]|nr:ParB/RepB/Spo0J family partition protein [Treponemataceae bacterium]